MGCFDVADGISGLTIKHGDKAGLILLVPNSDYPHSTGKGGTTILSPTTNLVGKPNETFTPFCLPIWGEYNDYGMLEKIEKDMTVEGLEKYFDTTIENILEIVTSGRGIFDSSSHVHATYGNGLDIAYSDYKNPISDEWMEKAGFRRLDNKKDKELVKLVKKMNKDGLVDRDDNPRTIDTKNVWILPGTPIVKLWDPKGGKDKSGSWDESGLPRCWVEVGKSVTWKDHAPEQCARTYWAEYEDNSTIKWNDTNDKSQKDFAECIYDKTNFGFFGTGRGIMLGVKKEYWKRVEELKDLSGMWIDRKLYNEITEPKVTPVEKKSDGMLDNVYPSKHMMPLLGFKYVKMVSGEDPTKEVEDDGMPLARRSDKPRLLVYTHEVAPDYYFAVEDCADNMSVDLYDKNMKDLDRAAGMNGENYSVSTFSPNGVQNLLAVLTGGKKTGTKIPVNHLLDLPPNYFFYKKMKDFMTRRKNQRAVIDAWEEKTAYLKELSEEERQEVFKNRTEEEQKEVEEMVSLRWRLSDDDRDEHGTAYSLGVYAKFKRKFDIYGDAMVEISDEFQETTSRYKKFFSIMYRTNKSFFPSSHHWQHGEFNYQAELHAQITKIAVEKHNDRSEWYDEGEEEMKEPIPIPVHVGEGIKAYMSEGVLKIERQVEEEA